MAFYETLPPALMTSDKKELIKSEKNSPAAFLIRSGQQSSLPQSSYGNGFVFGSINCFQLLVENNFNEKRLTSEYCKHFGIEIWKAEGYLTDSHIFLPELSNVSHSDARLVAMFEKLTGLPSRRYDKQYLTTYSSSINTLIGHDNPKQLRLNDLLPYPLKFSFNKDAAFEDLSSFSGHSC